MFNAVIDAPFGKIGVRTDASVVREIVYLPVSVKNVDPDTPLAKRAVEQIERYFERASASFDLPLAEVGTAFQHRVWDAICAIPPGVVLTYGQVAKQVGSAPRAVGQACGANYFPLVIPCHRVVASGGLGGFANHDDDGYYLRVKRWLLAHEGVPYR
ncbi:methylated-DNA--[protein]-cysteine S-methyltransferase [Burkholderia stagnalis]|uniref:methylated-DNA--[protein]-cysteine S-methyltransferase n=1 Tax=Burkholderia stagnalis TaxID=1503054 RepID=UPI000756BB5F|nr:methylated-DNA--[protein]-cysteine S-methyltransferase [Burkholderia stagnalis]KVC67138.1 cysteine methyltransferase [Burkholderia stagnalis]KVN18353.1 cysteine methyltransferase [Burkholderia stagnalis]KVN66776.1 cysteine methyltransferase [Burkholderia stagnalis]KWI69977.1 cysteine methyltransferase [Burkholderia stagnalis]KWK32464.1 cysteine methyltransferase [Burkholderia stagnalis]